MHRQKSGAALTQSLTAPSSARFQGRQAAEDGGSSIARHKTRLVSMDFVGSAEFNGAMA